MTDDAAEVGGAGTGGAAPGVESGGDGAHLSSPPVGVRTRGLAVALGVSDQSVLNWVAAGMPVAGADNRGRLFDVEACRAWHRKNRGGTLHGGKRRDSGRKAVRSPGELTGELARADVRELNRESAKEVLAEIKAGPAPPREERLSFDGLAALSHDQLRMLAWLEPEESGFTANQATRLQQLARSQRDQMEIAEARGKLHDAAACNAATTQHLTLLRTKLATLAGRGAPVIVAAVRTGPEMVPVVKAELVKLVDEVMREIAADPMGLAA